MKIDEQNKEIALAEHPSCIPDKKTFRFNEIDVSSPGEGEVLLKSFCVSVDPGMRGFMDKGEDDAAGSKFKLNEPITSRTVAQVIKSRNTNFRPGVIVHGRLAWQKYQAISPDTLQLVNPDLAPISTAEGILGVPGLAAYFGMLKIGRPIKGETVVVSGAAGGVGPVWKVLCSSILRRNSIVPKSNLPDGTLAVN